MAREYGSPGSVQIETVKVFVIAKQECFIGHHGEVRRLARQVEAGHRLPAFPAVGAAEHALLFAQQPPAVVSGMPAQGIAAGLIEFEAGLPAQAVVQGAIHAGAGKAKPYAVGEFYFEGFFAALSDAGGPLGGKRKGEKEKEEQREKPPRRDGEKQVHEIDFIDE